MNKRAFLALVGGAAFGGAVAAWPRLTRAQPRVFTIGLLWVEPTPYREAFLGALSDLGYVENRTLRLVDRTVTGSYGQLDENARGLVSAKVDLIVAFGGAAPMTAARATKDIPILVISGDSFVDLKLAESLNRPGGNVTGMETQINELTGKRVQLLKELVPNLSRLGIVSVPEGSAYAPFMRDVEAAARTLKLEAYPAEVRALDDLEGAFEALSRARVDGLLMATTTLFVGQSKRIVALAAKHRLPAVYTGRRYASDGGLASYGIDIVDVCKRAAAYVDRILKGALPRDLPIQRPTKFELIVNLKTAKALGLTIPPTVLARADEVIE